MMAGLAHRGRRTEQAAIAWLCDGLSPASEASGAKARMLARQVRLRSFSDVVKQTLKAGAAESGLGFSLLGGPREAEALARAFGESEGGDRWPVLTWLRVAAAREGAATVVVRAGDGSPAGFVSCRRVASVEIDDGDDLRLCYSVRPDYVYVAPGRRGMGYSSGLRRFLMQAIDCDLADLSEIDAGGLPMAFEVLGLAESEEGADFMNRLRLDIATSVERLFDSSRLKGFGYETVKPAF